MSLAGGDLTTVANFSAYTGLSNGNPALISGLITRSSRWVLSQINRSSIVPRKYIDVFDGSGNNQIVLPNWPVLSVDGFWVGGATVGQSTSLANPYFANPGWTYAQWSGVPPGEPAVIGLSGSSFWRGSRNVQISYVAGYAVIDEPADIPTDPPYQVTPLQPYGIWATDEGVAGFTPGSAGIPLTTGQYIPPAPDLTSNARTYYEFSPEDAGKTVLLTYGFVPADLEQVVLEMSIERSAYRTRPGIKSQMLAGQETISYADIGMSSFANSVLSAYTSVLPPAMGPLL